MSVAFLGIFPTAVGYVLWSYVLSRTAVSTVTGSLNVLPIVSLVIAWLWLGGLATITGVIVLSSRGKAEQRKLPMPSVKKWLATCNKRASLPRVASINNCHDFHHNQKRTINLS